MSIINFLQTLIPHSPAVIVGLITSGVGVSVVLQLIKHFGKLQDAKKTVMFLLAVLSGMATYGDSIIQFAGQNPNLVAGANLGWIVTIAVFVHRFVVSPIYSRIVSYLDGIYADHLAYQAEKKTGVPAETPSTTGFGLS